MSLIPLFGISSIKITGQSKSAVWDYLLQKMLKSIKKVNFALGWWRNIIKEIILKKYYAAEPHTVAIKKQELALYLCLGKTHTRNQFTG